MSDASGSQQVDTGLAATPDMKDEEATQLISAPNWDDFNSLPSFDLRNGDPSDAQTVFIKSTIKAVFHWVPIDNLGPNDAMKAVDGFVRSHAAHIATHAPPSVTERQRRKAAIILGVTRAIVTAYYRILPSELIAGEATSPLLRVVRNPAGALRFITIAGVSAEVKKSLDTDFAYTETERNVIASIIKCAVGIPAMQGYSLIMTNHHYLSDPKTQSRKVYAVAEKAYWRGTDVENWYNEDIDFIQDAMWHKSCHPIQISLKTLVAMDERTAKMISRAGAGACASRLPAVESELRAANSYLTLMQTVRPMFTCYGGTINWTVLERAMSYVKAYPPNVANPAPSPAIPAELTATITNRETAIRHLTAVTARNKDDVAFCYGFYCAMSDSEVTGMGAQVVDTLKTSYALAKLPSGSFASYNAGRQTYGDFVAARTAQRSSGQYNPPDLTLI